LTITGNHRVYAVFAFIEALLNLGLSIVLVDRFGVVGVVLGTLIARVFVASPVMLWQSLRLLKTDRSAAALTVRHA
jgi:O-antigen/teichoic acid export membrane protein